MQSWCLYKNTFKFIENPLNNRKIRRFIDVYTTCNFSINGKIYNDFLAVEPPLNDTLLVYNCKKESKKISNKLYNINTSNLKKLTFNKNIETIELYKKLEKRILSKNNKIIRNYLKKGITFKYKKRLMEVIIKQNELLIIFLKDVKHKDVENKLFLRKGYENQSLCYGMFVNDDVSFNYALYLFDEEYNIVIDNSTNCYVNDLFKQLSNRVKLLDKTVKCKKLARGIAFYSTRNFMIVEKRRYHLRIRLLNVEDNNNILLTVNGSSYNSFIKFYNIKKAEEIDLLIHYIKKSLYVSSII